MLFSRKLESGELPLPVNYALGMANVCIALHGHRSKMVDNPIIT